MAGSLPLGPRLVIAGTHSGVGKTTVATGMMAALARRGLAVAPAKVGPDYIDPGYHAVATGRPGRNLDSWICGPGAVAPLAAAAARGADVMVVEGVMGLFDGAGRANGGPTPQGTPRLAGLPAASTAEVAAILEAPVVLVVDAAAMAASVAAVVHGFATYSPRTRVSGVILNRVGSDAHEESLLTALRPLGIPVLGALRRSDRLRWRDRHLGLVPVVEDPRAVGKSLERLAAQVEGSCDLDGLLALARSAPGRSAGPLVSARRVASATVAVAAGRAFSFTYEDNLERLRQAGADTVTFDPASDERLPAGVQGLLVGGGFPESHARRLGSNQALLSEVRRRISGGLVTWAECGGLLWLCRSLEGTPLCGVLPAEARMTPKLKLGYRVATALEQNPVLAPGRPARAHEFHYSGLDRPGEALAVEGGGRTSRAGFASPTLLASYLHLHLGADPAPAERFVLAASRYACPVL